MKPFILILLTLAAANLGCFLLTLADGHRLIALIPLALSFWLIKKILAHPDVRA